MTVDELIQFNNIAIVYNDEEKSGHSGRELTYISDIDTRYMSLYQLVNNEFGNEVPVNIGTQLPVDKIRVDLQFNHNNMRHMDRLSTYLNKTTVATLASGETTVDINGLSFIFTTYSAVDNLLSLYFTNVNYVKPKDEIVEDEGEVPESTEQPEPEVTEDPTNEDEIPTDTKQEPEPTESTEDPVVEGEPTESQSVATNEIEE